MKRNAEAEPRPTLAERPAALTEGGVLVIDKPTGPTSHDVVARLRRALGVKRIGHAGTLDPMASGVLVVLVGEATKLAPYLTAQDKRYDARVVLGVGTDTLDAEGEVTETAELPSWLDSELAALAEAGAPVPGELLARAAPRLAAALDAERARGAQTPPAYSAIKVAGRRSYALARAGEAVDLSPRAVEVRSLQLLRARCATSGATQGDPAPGAAERAGLAELDLALEVTKGYYVRSLARDLGAHLGVPAHLAALRRTASGAFTLNEAVALDAGPKALAAALCPLATAAARSLPSAQLTERGARRARLGQPLTEADFAMLPGRPGAALWLAPDGRPVALGAYEPRCAADMARDSASAGNEGKHDPASARFSVLRGFSAGGATPE